MMESDSLQWRRFNEEKAEFADLPRNYKDVSPFVKLMFLRAIRPDRITSALTEFVRTNMGDLYVDQSPFNIDTTYNESTAQTPLFFVLFPGVEPTADVERIGLK